MNDGLEIRPPTQPPISCYLTQIITRQNWPPPPLHTHLVCKLAFKWRQLLFTRLFCNFYLEISPAFKCCSVGEGNWALGGGARHECPVQICLFPKEIINFLTLERREERERHHDTTAAGPYNKCGRWATRRSAAFASSPHGRYCQMAYQIAALDGHNSIPSIGQSEYYSFFLVDFGCLSQVSIVSIVSIVWNVRYLHVTGKLGPFSLANFHLW